MYPPHTLEVGAGSRLGAHNEMPSKVAVQQPRAPVRLGTAVPSHSYSKGAPTQQLVAPQLPPNAPIIQKQVSPEKAAEVERLYAEGAEQYFQGDYAATEQLYCKALKINPRHVRSLCNYGALLHNVKHDHTEAASMYNMALEIDRNDVVTLYNYALLLEVAQKDYLGAERLYLRALQVDPMHVDTLVNYGSLLKSVHNEMATAEKMYVTALQVEPDHVDALCNYALLLRDGMGNRTKAKELIQRALRVAPNDEWLLKHASAF